MFAVMLSVDKHMTLTYGRPCGSFYCTMSDTVKV